jgi:hypothetical protein
VGNLLLFRSRVVQPVNRYTRGEQLKKQ